MWPLTLTWRLSVPLSSMPWWLPEKYHVPWLPPEIDDHCWHWFTILVLYIPKSSLVIVFSVCAQTQCVFPRVSKAVAFLTFFYILLYIKVIQNYVMHYAGVYISHPCYTGRSCFGGTFLGRVNLRWNVC